MTLSRRGGGWITGAGGVRAGLATCRYLLEAEFTVLLGGVGFVVRWGVVEVQIQQSDRANYYHDVQRTHMTATAFAADTQANRQASEALGDGVFLGLVPRGFMLDTYSESR